MVLPFLVVLPPKRMETLFQRFGVIHQFMPRAFRFLATSWQVNFLTAAWAAAGPIRSADVKSIKCPGAAVLSAIGDSSSSAVTVSQRPLAGVIYRNKRCCSCSMTARTALVKSKRQRPASRLRTQFSTIFHGAPSHPINTTQPRKSAC